MKKGAAGGGGGAHGCLEASRAKHRDKNVYARILSRTSRECLLNKNLSVTKISRSRNRMILAHLPLRTPNCNAILRWCIKTTVLRIVCEYMSTMHSYNHSSVELTRNIHECSYHTCGIPWTFLKKCPDTISATMNSAIELTTNIHEYVTSCLRYGVLIASSAYIYVCHTYRTRGSPLTSL